MNHINNNINYWKSIFENAKSESEKKIALKRIAKIQNAEILNYEVKNENFEIVENQNLNEKIEDFQNCKNLEVIQAKLLKFERMYKNNKNAELAQEIIDLKKEINELQFLNLTQLPNVATGFSKLFGDSLVWDKENHSVQFMNGAHYNRQELLTLLEASDWTKNMVHTAKTLFRAELTETDPNIFDSVPDLSKIMKTGVYAS